MKTPTSVLSLRSLLWVGAALLGLAGCAGPDKPKPTPLEPNVALLGVRQVWANSVGPVDFPLDARVVDGRIYVAGGRGTVAALDAATGADVWRTSVGAALSAGVGSDGKYSAVVTQENELVVLDGPKTIWRQKLPAMTLTPPYVGGARVFVLSADRSVQAFDVASGRRLWVQQRAGAESLVLAQAGLMTAVGDTLVVGLGGRVIGMNPLNGSSRWELAAASSRGTNEVERLVDVVAGTARQGDQLCVRAFQYAVTCLDAAAGKNLWSKPANGASGITGDASLLVGVESDGRVLALRRDNGERLWVSERLRFRTLGSPLLLGRSLVVGDDTGLLHFFSREDGSPLDRVSTDGSAIRQAPVLSGQTLVAVTAKGNVLAFRPQ